MPIPDVQNLMLPLLQLAADGADHRLSDTIGTLAAQLQLSADERAELLPSGPLDRYRVDLKLACKEIRGVIYG